MTITDIWPGTLTRLSHPPRRRQPTPLDHDWTRPAQDLVDQLLTTAGPGDEVAAAVERARVLSTLLRVDLTILVAPELIDSLQAAVRPSGPANPTAPGPSTGQAPDPSGRQAAADVGATALISYALALLGRPTDPTTLLDHATTLRDQRADPPAPVTAQAYLLEALAAGDAGRRYGDVMAARRTVSARLCDQQLPDGSWPGRPADSPYATTACCALALQEAGLGARASAAVLRAVDWVLRTQRTDGSWGRWSGTAEETGYALQVLLATTDPPSARMAQAADRGRTHLGTPDSRWPDPRPDTVGGGPGRSGRVVRAGIVAAGHLARQVADGEG
ncbi:MULTISPECIES: prenyltransferase/squalene oxidase repeat-containing protein [unclassified Solwaraspora]|uniref:prenyltransferase/squalene oxidase repeat-containing protein n=1 Tax=unclassified Solwaraspora TaxID=2627926 RepID=UPI00259B9C32|nr:prenyltransferase/squalene oxidase repeat-containing protein [Solwaraspora sp. WMMA2056]WJK39542.1 prenyltransferase/squalene oxidase repeat-containing protein [Solwaraspora sp. WMMA2056]